MKNVLFVCTGNTCRSPMCAALLNDKYSRGNTVHAFSAGLFADGSPISRYAVSALADSGIADAEDNHYTAHVSHTVTEEDMASADQIYGVTPVHAAQLRLLFPAYAEKIDALPLPITDPFGSDLSGYKRCLTDIDAALTLLFHANE